MNTSANMDDIDLQLDEMELAAAAAGYYYFNSLSRMPPLASSQRRRNFMAEVLDGPDDMCREMFRMDKHVFHKLCSIFRHRGLLRDTCGVMIEEQVAIFLNIIGHSERNRVVQERFQHSGETISRYFNNVLKSIRSLSREFLQPPPQTTPMEIHCSKRLYPYFKDCIGVIDGMHIPANVPAKDQSRFRNKKGFLSQNVLAACTFDLQFIFIYPGWEGSATDSRVLRAVLDDPTQNFPCIPEGKYYLVDNGYINMEGFIAPYPGVRSHLHQFRGANQLPRTAMELFNHRHSSLRNAIHKSFNVLKKRFPILKVATQYGIQIQRDIVIAACVLHNFVRHEERKDWLFASVEGVSVEDLSEFDDEADIPELGPSMQEEIAFSVRESMAGAMWNDFINTWDEW
ncbi:Protein ALP1-like [Linum perenne]